MGNYVKCQIVETDYKADRLPGFFIVLLYRETIDLEVIYGIWEWINNNLRRRLVFFAERQKYFLLMFCLSQ